MKTVSLALLVLALLVLGFLLLRGGSEDETVAVTTPEAPAPEEGESPPAELPDIASPPGEPRATREVVEEAPHATGPANPIEPSLAEGVEVLVVHGETEAAVPGAEVYFLDIESLEIEALARSKMDIQEIFHRYARRFLADDGGRVTVPPANAAVMATAPDLWGGGQLRKDQEEPYTLELYPDPLLRVRVVNAAGEPLAGIPVTIMRGEYGYGDPPVDTRAPDGIAEFEHVLAMARMEEVGPIRVGLALPLHEEVAQEIDVEDPPQEPIEFVAPPLGRLEVRVVSEGRALDEPVFVTVLPAREDEADEDRGFRRSMALQTNRRVLDVGEERVVVPVGIGLELEVTASTESGLGPVEERVSGPRTAGATKSVELRLVPIKPVLVGRIVDPEGAPVASTALRNRLRTVREGGSGSTGSQTRTDEEGRFRYVMRDDRPFEEGTRTLTFTTEDDAPEPAEARVDLSYVLPPGETDLGDLILGSKPLLVSGTVVDEAGAPVPKAQIRVAREERYGSSNEHVYWDSLSDLRGTSDDDGRFRIHGMAEEGLLGIRARHDGYAQGEYVRFSPFSSDVVIILESAGRIVGRVLHDGEGSRPPVDIRARLDTGEDEGSHGVSFEDEGRFEIRSLPPGSYTVTVTLGSSQNPLLEVSGVVVRSGETTEDPRLAEIDLRGRLHRFTVTVVDVDGKPPERVMASYRSPNDPEGEESWAMAWRDGLLRIDTLHEAVDVDISAQGYRSLRLEGLSSDEKVVLQGGIPVRLVLADRGAMPGPEHGLHAFLVRQEHRMYDYPEPVPFEPDGSVRLTLPRPGTYHLDFMIGRVREGGGSMSLRGFISPSERQEIEVLDSHAEQVFTVPLLREAVRAGIEKMGEDR